VAVAAKALAGLVSGAQQAIDLALQDAGASVKDLLLRADYGFEGLSSTIQQLGDQLEGALMQVCGPAGLRSAADCAGALASDLAPLAAAWSPQASPDLAALLEGREGPLKQLKGLADSVQGSGIEWYFRRQVSSLHPYQEGLGARPADCSCSWTAGGAVYDHPAPLTAAADAVTAARRPTAATLPPSCRRAAGW
jgi:hypothetical protein